MTVTVTYPPTLFNNLEHLMEEVDDFLVRIARDMRTYSEADLKHCALKVAEYLATLTAMLEELLAGLAHAYRKELSEVEAHKISDELNNLSDENK